MAGIYKYYLGITMYHVFLTKIFLVHCHFSTENVPCFSVEVAWFAKQRRSKDLQSSADFAFSNDKFS